MKYVYGYFKTRDEAERYLEHMYACGDLCESEYVRIYAAFGGKRWAIELKGN